MKNKGESLIMQQIIVSLTSYPKRIDIVDKVIKSLWNQEICPDEIILYLSVIEFPQKEKDLPDKLVEMLGKRGFKIKWVEENLKSHKKYYYVLRDNNCKAIVITVDDDVIYSKTLISDLIYSYNKFPMAISARRTRIMLREGENLAKYNQWDNFFGELICEPRMDLCAIGAGGVLYPPYSVADRWFDKEKIKSMSENQDDLWLKYNEIVDRIPVVYVRPTKEDQPIENVKGTALSTDNMYGIQNDVSIEMLNEWLGRDYIESYRAWFASLMQKEDYVSYIRSYYFNIVKKSFDEMKEKPIYLYGAGKKAKAILKMLDDFGMVNRIKAVVVSNIKGNSHVMENVEVKQFDEIDKTVPFGVVYGIGKAFKDEVNDLLKDYDCDCLELDVQGIFGYYYKR